MDYNVIKTPDGYMAQTADGSYLQDSQGNNLFDTAEELKQSIGA